MFSSHGREIGTQDALKKESQGLSQVVAGNPGFPRLVPVTYLSHLGLKLLDPHKPVLFR